MHGPMAMHIRIQEHLATICSLIASAGHLKKLNGQPFSSADFITYSKKEAPKPLDEITDFAEFLQSIR
jgi:hypothetical protein